MLPAGRYGPPARAFFARFRARYGRLPGAYAIYGYEAMKAVLEMLRQAGRTPTTARR